MWLCVKWHCKQLQVCMVYTERVPRRLQLHAALAMQQVNSAESTPLRWIFKATLTLRAPLSGTFLQTLPDLVTPLKGHSLSSRSCPPTWSAALSVRFGYWKDCGSNLASKHVRKHETHPPRAKKKRKKKKKKKEEEAPSGFKPFWFYFSWRKPHGQL